MSDKISIDPTRTALLVMDVQIMTVDGYAVDAEGLLARTAGFRCTRACQSMRTFGAGHLLRPEGAPSNAITACTSHD